MDVLIPCLVVRGGSVVSHAGGCFQPERIDVSMAVRIFQDVARLARYEVGRRLVVVHTSSYFVDVASLPEPSQSILSIRYDDGGIWAPILLAMLGASRDAHRHSLLVCREIMISGAGAPSLGREVFAGQAGCMAVGGEMTEIVARAISSGDIEQVSVREVRITPRQDLMRRARQLGIQCKSLVDQMATE